jgi:hypothetical protein
MAKAKATSDERETIYRLKRLHNIEWGNIYPLFPHIAPSTQRCIATRYGQSLKSCSVPAPTLAPKHKITDDIKGDDRVLESTSRRIITIDDLTEVTQIDLEKWSIDRYIENAWEVTMKGPDDTPITSTNFQVKAYLSKLKTEYSIQLIEDMRDELRSLSPTFKLPTWPEPRFNEDPHTLEISIPDLHFGKSAWEGATGQSYNMNIAENLYRTSAIALAQSINNCHITQILLPIGHDLFHVDTPAGETAKGTRMDVDGNTRQHFRRVRIMVRETIDMLLNIAPVRVIIVSGNHDKTTMYHLGEALDDWFYNNPHVIVDNDPKSRKYFAWGNNLIGFAHGDNEKITDLPMLMATESPDYRPINQYHEWHVAHKHTKKEIKYLPVDEISGFRIRQIPSLSAPDLWHYDKGFVNGIRSAEAYLWSQDNGMVAQYYANLQP